MIKFLKFLSGKKSVIASIIGVLLTYCAAKGWIGEQEVILIGSLKIAIFGGASFATSKYVYKKVKKSKK